MNNTKDYIRFILRDNSSYFLIIMNSFPILGVIIWGWDPVSLVYIYIAETIIIGIINFFKIIISRAEVHDQTGKKIRFPFLGKLFIGVFFLFHYNAFNFAQIELFTSLSTSENNSIEYFFNYFLNDDLLLVALLIIVISHLFTFFQDFIKKKQYDFLPSIVLLFLPYPRIFVQQFVGILGAFFVMIFNLPIFFLILLQICKTISELFSHVFINEKLEKVMKSGDAEKFKKLFKRSA